MNEKIIGKVFPEALKLIKEKRCPICTNEINVDDLYYSRLRNSTLSPAILPNAHIDGSLTSIHFEFNKSININ